MARMRPIPFALVAPATIILFGAAVTLASTLLGLRELRSHAQDSAAFHSRVMAATFAARLAELPDETRADALVVGAQKCACTLLIIDRTKTVRHAAPRQPLSQTDLAELKTGPGSVLIGDKTHWYSSASLGAGEPRIFALAEIPDIASAENVLISSMVAFATLLLAAAGFVGWALARDVHSDVLYVRGQIVSMAEERALSKTKTIPVRTIDQVGELTAS